MEYNIEPDESVSHAILASVSEYEKTVITNLPPLYETIDPDALDTLFSERSSARISFTYNDLLIRVCGDEHITVKPP